MEKGYLLYTVDNALVECLNVIWKHATLLSDINLEDAKSAVEYLLKIYGRLNAVTVKDLAAETMAIAKSLKVPIYDALYIALAQRENSILFTSDKKLCKAANAVIDVKLLEPT